MRRSGPPRRPVAKPPPGLGRPAARRARRVLWGLALGAPVVLIVAAFAFAVTLEGPDRQARPSGPGVTTRTAFLLVQAGRSRAEVRAALGPPHATRPDPAARGGPAECWVYAARSGRPITYELCFTGAFVASKAILPYAVQDDRAVAR